MTEIKYHRIIKVVMETPWAILPNKLAIIHDLLVYRADGQRLTDEEIKAAIEGAGPRAQRGRSGGGVAVLPMVGTIVPRGDMLTQSSGGLSVERLRREFREALADPNVEAIVLDVDSPGGQVGGVEELSAEIYQARGQKPIVAVANNLAASAAYWIASAADELVVTPSGEVGSIGVFAMHEDLSEALKAEGVTVNLISAGKYKTEGNPFEPLSDEAREAIQARVNDYYHMFTSAVARNRSIGSWAAVVNGFGQGRIVGATEAVSLGMADRVATLDETVARLLPGQRRGRAAASDVEFRKRRLRLASRRPGSVEIG